MSSEALCLRRIVGPFRDRSTTLVEPIGFITVLLTAGAQVTLQRLEAQLGDVYCNAPRD